MANMNICCNITNNYYPTIEFKYCTRCHIAKPTTEFHYSNKTTGSLHSHCKSCKCQSRREKYKNNREKELAQKKEYYQMNRDYIIQRQTLYNANNREKINEQRKERYHNDEQFRHLQLIRQRFSTAVKNKFSTTTQLTGCSKEWLELWLKYCEAFYCFNSIKTHMDHFFPLSLYDLHNPVDQYNAFNWKNIRTIDALDNLKKSNKFPTEKEIEGHYQHITDFLDFMKHCYPHILY